MSRLVRFSTKSYSCGDYDYKTYDLEKDEDKLINKLNGKLKTVLISDYDYITFNKRVNKVEEKKYIDPETNEEVFVEKAQWIDFKKEDLVDEIEKLEKTGKYFNIDFVEHQYLFSIAARYFKEVLVLEVEDTSLLEFIINEYNATIGDFELTKGGEKVINLEYEI